MRVVVFPAYRENPFLGMMLGAAEREGAEIVDARTLDELEAALAERPAETVLHMHWTNPIAQSTNNPVVAARNAGRFRRMVRGAKQRGARVVWTVHNVLPHGAKHARVERGVHRFLAEAADRIHVMHPGTAALAAPHYALPGERIRHIPHPSYAGAVPPAVDRIAARERLAIEPEALAVLFLGQMRAYKGVLDLIDAAGRAAAQRPLVLLLAGNATPDETAAIDAALAAHPRLRAVRHLRFVDHAELPGWFAAADVVALPYRRILNSGSVLLAATYGVPALLPREAHLEADYGDQAWVTLFDGAEGLERALEQARVDDGAARAAALADAAAWTPEDASRALLGVLREALGER
ncbi:glycosyltransferase [Agrococcus carbonis]|uniref:Glycosyltransferase involved in cell wall bisynthesis n=1 Tax=Agrococcus carbonis TaxID=684552 RepID=A0A1H1M5B7_9MICO|nr:glycosyltransferase [Agrococcus carbonis]SDR81840.1 Glycosyltransferase involved in cell wall bisynthesis [Agrococcus carbonis]